MESQLKFSLYLVDFLNILLYYQKQNQLLNWNPFQYSLHRHLKGKNITNCMQIVKATPVDVVCAFYFFFMTHMFYSVGEK